MKSIEHDNLTQDLIYDVGLNRGQDTANYLAKGFRVVAIEANPDLVEECSERFNSAIKMGRLSILEGAILREGKCDHHDGKVTFHLNDNDAWGTAITDTSLEYGERGAVEGRTIEVPVLDLGDVLAEHGIPFYLKTDIEGADIACLEAFRTVKAKPAYLSLESDVDSFASVKQELELLTELGYDRFQVINQKDLVKIMSPDSILEYGGSGDFGPWLPKSGWMSEAETRRKYKELFVWYKLFSRRGLLRETPLQKPLTQALSRLLGYTIPSWHDTHARHKYT